MVGSPMYLLHAQTPKWVKPDVISITGARGYNVRDLAQGEIERCAEAQRRWDAQWDKAVAAEALVAPERKPFYEANVLTMIAIHRESNRILSLVTQAVLAAQNGQTADARNYAQQALASFDQIEKAETAAEYGRWKNWYRGDWLTGIPRTREMVQSFLSFLDDPLKHMAPPIFWNGWEAYYHITHYQGDRSVDVH